MLAVYLAQLMRGLIRLTFAAGRSGGDGARQKHLYLCAWRPVAATPYTGSVLSGASSDTPVLSLDPPHEFHYQRLRELGAETRSALHETSELRRKSYGTFAPVIEIPTNQDAPATQIVLHMGGVMTGRPLLPFTTRGAPINIVAASLLR